MNSIPSELLLGAIDDGITVQSASGALVFANERAAHLSGYPSAAAMLATPITEVMQRFEMFDEHDAPLALAKLPGRLVFEGGDPREQIIKFRVCATGEERWSLVRATLVQGEHGAFVVNVFRDVTAERKQDERRLFLLRAAAELNSSLDYQRTLATMARLAVPSIADWCAVDVIEPDGLKRLAVAHVDPSKIEFVHEIERRYPPDPNAPNGVPNVLRTGKPEMVADIPDEALVAGSRDAEHLRLIRKLGLRSYIAAPIRRGEQTIGVISLITAESNRLYGEADLEIALTLADRAAVAIENARLFRELETARTAAEQASRVKDEFLAMLGHELRNPLAPILTALEMMRETGSQHFTRERAVIDRQLRHMVRLVDDLLDVSRIARGKIDLAQDRVELADVVGKAVEMSSPLVLERDHALAVDVPRGLVVRGDAIRLAQVVSNLVTNAAKYTPRGGHVTIAASQERGRVILEVRDDGIGIAADMLPRVFDLFVQEKQGSDRAQGGLGLGLTIVRNLIELHGGTVTAHSAGTGKGAVIRVELPAPAGVMAHVEAVPSKPAVARTTRRGNVLIVDDNVDARELLAMALETQGYTVITAADGPAALEVAVSAQPAIALLDVGLPEMDGYELGRRLHALPGLEKLPLVAVTGYGQASDRARSEEAGFAGHLVKPVTIAAIAAMLEKVAS